MSRRNSQKESREDKIKAVFKKAQKTFELYEKFYLGLSESAKKYLSLPSGEYKRLLQKFQVIIHPAIQKSCPTCRELCCSLYTPQIRICDAIGWFNNVDYMLVRYDTVLPPPNYENAERNLCPFWSDGCILPPDCRSYLCIEYFCDKVRKELDMQLISSYLNKSRLIINNFSTLSCMG